MQNGKCQIAYLAKYAKWQIAYLAKYAKWQMSNCLFNQIRKMANAKLHI